MELTKEVDIPKQVPPGKYTVLADVNTVDKEKITCMESTVSHSVGASIEKLWKKSRNRQHVEL